MGGHYCRTHAETGFGGTASAPALVQLRIKLNVCKVLKCMLMLSPFYDRCNVKIVKKLLLS